MSKVILFPAVVIALLIGTAGAAFAATREETEPSTDGDESTPPAGGAGGGGNVAPPAEGGTAPTAPGGAYGVPGAGAGNYGVVGGAIMAGADAAFGIGSELGKKQDEEREMTLDAAREEYQRRVRGLQAQAASDRAKIRQSELEGDVPAGTNKAGYWLSETFFADVLGYSVADRQEVLSRRLNRVKRDKDGKVKKTPDGKVKWEDWSVKWVWEDLNAIAIRADQMITANSGLADPARMKEVHRLFDDYGKDLTSGPYYQLWDAAEAQWQASRALLIDPDEIVDTKGEV